MQSEDQLATTPSTLVLKEPIDHEGLVNKSKFKGDSLRRCMSSLLIQDQDALLGGEFNPRVTILEPTFKIEDFRSNNDENYGCDKCRSPNFPPGVNVLQKMKPEFENDTDSPDDGDCILDICKRTLGKWIGRYVCGLFTTPEERASANSGQPQEESALCLACGAVWDVITWDIRVPLPPEAK